jgi:predicted HicB family RNase H-like nuclease
VPAPTEPKKVGRPKLPKGEAKGKIVAIRFASEQIEAITAAAKARNQTVSQWIRGTLNAAIQG